MFKLKLSHLGATIALLSTALTIADSKAANALDFVISPVGVTNAPLTWGGRTNTIIDFSTASDGDLPSNTPALTVIDANNGNATFTETNDPSAFDSSPALFTGSGRYLKVGGSTGSSVGVGDVRIDFAAPRGLGYFGLYWASPSTNDRITFTLRNVTGSGTTTEIYNAAQVFAGLGYDFTGNNQNNPGRYVNFFVTSAEPRTIASVLLEDLGDTNGSRAFEVDNIAYHQIPTPALLPALFGLSVGFWNKRRKQATLA
jgi:hypothetical protein